MSVINQEYYGDDFRWFIATVIDNSPPYGMEGRIQIRIQGIHSRDTNDIPQKDLPWAQVMTPSDTFGGSGFGTHCQILPGSLVFGMFLDGVHSQLPMVLGSLPRIEYPSSVQAATQTDLVSNPFSYEFQQSNSQLQDPVFYNDPEATNTQGTAADAVTFFIDNGLNAREASSITGILDAVSGLDATNTANGFGIAGYPTTSPRYSRFVAYIQRLSPSRTAEDFAGQLMYVMQEIGTSKSTAYSKMIRTTDIGEQVLILSKYYLHPLTDVNIADAITSAVTTYKGLGAR